MTQVLYLHFSKPLKQSNPRTQIKHLVLKAYTHNECLFVSPPIQKRFIESSFLISIARVSKAIIKR